MACDASSFCLLICGNRLENTLTILQIIFRLNYRKETFHRGVFISVSHIVAARLSSISSHTTTWLLLIALFSTVNWSDHFPCRHLAFSTSCSISLDTFWSIVGATMLSTCKHVHCCWGYHHTLLVTFGRPVFYSDAFRIREGGFIRKEVIRMRVLYFHRLTAENISR